MSGIPENVPNTLMLEEIRKEDITSVGGKGASLGEMASLGLPVPKAFVVTAQAFRRFLIESRLEEAIFSRFGGLNVEDNQALEMAAKEAQALVLGAPMPKEIADDIREAYRKLAPEPLIVAVRSSVTAEDLPDASFAGQQETFLNIRGDEDLLEAVQKCWASLYGARAICYRAWQGFDDRSVNIAVVVQQLVHSEKAGVMFTSHSVTGKPLTIIDGSWGLGVASVTGTVSPDRYVYDQRAGKVVGRFFAQKLVEIVPDGAKGTCEVEVEDSRRGARVLSDEEIAWLARFGKIAEDHYGVPQKVDWAIVGENLFILQSYPITTINKAEAAGAAQKLIETKVLVQGIGAAPGTASGRVVVIADAKEIGVVKEGDILVTRMTTPDMVKALRRAGAIVTDEGGMTCHAAIVSRELETPAVVGSRTATQVLKTGMVVTVDGENGVVYEGEIAPAPTIKAVAEVASKASAVRLIAATSVKVNVSIPEAAKRAAATGADGVGLLRIEHLMLGLGRTPDWYIKNGRGKEFVWELYDGIKTVLDAFPGKPVWVRMIDAPTDEYRNMQGGEGEPREHNPMLGWRGIRRDLGTPQQFHLQVEAFKRLWDAGYDNLCVMFPMVNHPDEFLRAKAMMASFGVDVEKAKLGVMIEVPSSALIIEQFCEAGIKFASFGTNDLIQYTLAIDRNNEYLTDMYRPKHPAVLKLIDYVIGICREYGVECSICGQAGSDPEMAEWLTEHGIASISANIDAVAKIRCAVAHTNPKIVGLDEATNASASAGEDEHETDITAVKVTILFPFPDG